MKSLSSSQIRVLILALFLIVDFSLQAQSQQLLEKGHSHNDYLQKRPLYDALKYGFTSIEVDVYSTRKGVKVSHFPFSIKKKESLESLYLKPLELRVSENGGTVFKNDSTQLILMIDLKSNKKKLYSLLKQLFKKYEHLITIQNKEHYKWGPLQILLSGKPSLDNLLDDKSGYFSIDGQGDVWKSSYSSQLIPRASMNFNKHFKWKGKKDILKSEQQKLNSIVVEAHANKRKIRFWATKDSPKVWKVLLESNVDWISVDNLEKFHHYYLKHLK